MIYFIADTHFNDAAIMKYENRPFKNLTEMTNTIIKNWNNIVTNDDIVYILGDLGCVTKQIIQSLNGKKYLIKGNHDTEENQFYRDLGFVEVYDQPIILDSFWMLSHEPMYVTVNSPYANIFGHVHNNGIYNTVSERGYCVCVERIDYTPIPFTKIKQDIKSINN